MSSISVLSKDKSAGSNQASSNYYEVLIHMMEEKFNLLSPEHIPPLVEKYNLMPRLGG